MYRIKIFGAGSIGNHLAYACRFKNWEVTICDQDSRALERTKTMIYPTRYGKWDEDIKLINSKEKDYTKYDLVIIGTPPNSHADIAMELLKQNPPRIIQIEKPALTPNLDNAMELFNLSKKTGTSIYVGYNHTLTNNTKKAEEILSEGIIGSPLTITSMTREHWGGIFSAHPWLKGPEDTYLGYSEKGGGACCEHSHAINIWQHFARYLNLGKIAKVSALLNFVKAGKAEYDDLCFINVVTDKGIAGNIIQDVVTTPTRKELRIQGDKGFLEWHVNYKEGSDAIIFGDSKNKKEIIINKTRPDDFKVEIEHFEKLLNGENIQDSPISFERGLETMMVIAASFISNKLKKEVSIDYSKGYSLSAIN